MSSPTTHQHYGQRIQERRKDAGLSVERLRDELLLRIPRRYVPSTKTLHRLEAGEVDEAKVDAIVIYGMSKILNCRVSELSEMIAAEYDALDTLVASVSRCIATPPADQLRLNLAAA